MEQVLLNFKSNIKEKIPFKVGHTQKQTIGVN
jgi:hypothetical protein